jgi:hypothetical protein
LFGYIFPSVSILRFCPPLGNPNLPQVFLYLCFPSSPRSTFSPSPAYSTRHQHFGTFPSLLLSTCPSYLTRCVLTTPVIFVACYLLVCSPSPYFAHLSFPTPPPVLFFQSYSVSTFRMRIGPLVVSPSRRS